MGRSVQTLQSESDVHSLVLRSIEPHPPSSFSGSEEGARSECQGSDISK